AGRRQTTTIEGIMTATAPPIFDQKREAILDQAARLFNERGYDATSVRDIARAAGISQATLYYYIGSKADALLAIYTAPIDPKLRQLSAIVPSDAQADQKLRRFIRADLRAIARDYARWVIWSRDRNSLPPASIPELLAKRNRVDQLLTQLLEEGVAT